jgi:stage II sporulation protein P
MHDIHKEEIWVRILIFAICLVIFFKIFAPIIKPAIAASDISNGLNVYKKIFNKSNSVLEIEMHDDEDDDGNKKELFSILFKYLTNIDLGNPKSYITSQIPLMNLLDTTLISSSEEGPVIVVPRITDSTENTGNNANGSNNSGTDNTTKPGKTSEGQKVTPENAIPVKSRKLDATKPLILIYHTHATESYNPKGVPGKNYTTDSNENMLKIGEQLKIELEKYGIATIHDTTVHDALKREGAYAKSRPTVTKYLKKYPTLKLAIDLHRDDAGKSIVTALIGNEKYARVMFVVGMSYKNYTKNDVLVTKINEAFNYYYPKFSRGLYIRKGIFNQDISSRVILIELGSEESSQQEALNSTKIIAKVLSLFIK